MFKKVTRKKLLERKWLGIKEDGSNPALSRKRIKDNARASIRDLTLLAKIIPQNEFYDVFDEEILRKFLLAIFYSPERRLDGFMTNAELASILVDIGVGICIVKYEADNYETPHSAKPVIDYLNNTIKICSEVGYKSKLERIKKESSGKFVFMLKEVYKEDSRFDEYIIRELDTPEFFDKTIENIGYGALPTKIVITVVPKGSSKEDDDYQFIGIVTLNLDFDKLICEINYSPFSGDKIAKELHIRKKGDDYVLLKK